MERRRQVSVINLFFQETLYKDTPQVGYINRRINSSINLTLYYFRVYPRGDIPRAILKEEYVIVLYVAVLPDATLDSYTSYTEDKSRLQWFNDEGIVGDMRLVIF